MSKKIKCALIGPGNIGTDLLYKLKRSPVLEPVWMVGIDATSEGLARAREMGLKTTADGVDGLLAHVLADGVQIAFDATSAYVHAENSRKLNALGVLMIDLTPAAIHHEYIRVDIKPLVCEPSCEYLPHACVVIRPVYGPELELSVVILLGASVFKYHHGCHGVIAAYMRYIKCFKASCG